MAIRFDSGYNKNIRSIVANYNQRRKRMIKAGYKQVPRAALVSELKGRYSTRNELDRELNYLKNLGKKDLLRRVETSGGVKAIGWQYDYAKNNLKNAREYFVSEYKRVSKRVAKYPGERQYLDTIKNKINLLDMNIDYMNQSDFRSVITTIDEFAMSPSMRKAQYRGFLSEVDWVMEKIGYDEEKRDKFFKKFSKLTPTQFLYAYDNNDIIGKIYRLYHKDYGQEEATLTDGEDAETLMDLLTEQADVIIEDAKENAV